MLLDPRRLPEHQSLLWGRSTLSYGKHMDTVALWVSHVFSITTGRGCGNT